MCVSFLCSYRHGTTTLASTSVTCSRVAARPDLHGSLILPGLLACAQFPHDHPKGVDVTLLIVGLASKHFWSSPLWSAGLRFGAEPGAAPHSCQPKVTHLISNSQDCRQGAFCAGPANSWMQSQEVVGYRASAQQRELACMTPPACAHLQMCKTLTSMVSQA